MLAIKNMQMPKKCSECQFSTITYMDNRKCKISENCYTIKYTDNNIPTDCPLVEIVTCKDCKHWHDDGIMTTCDKNIGHGFPKDHYCADAERRK